MTWIYDHTEVLTVVAIFILVVGIIGTCAVIAAAGAPEASELEGAPRDRLVEETEAWFKERNETNAPIHKGRARSLSQNGQE